MLLFLSTSFPRNFAPIYIAQVYIEETENSVLEDDLEKEVPPASFTLPLLLLLLLLLLPFYRSPYHPVSDMTPNFSASRCPKAAPRSRSRRSLRGRRQSSSGCRCKRLPRCCFIPSARVCIMWLRNYTRISFVPSLLWNRLQKRRKQRLKPQDPRKGRGFPGDRCVASACVHLSFLGEACGEI
jgi:hypothetical protein